MFGAQMGSFHTPADLAEHSRHIAFHSWLIIKRLLFWRHLITQESSECRLVDSTIWLLNLLIKCIIEAFLMLRTQLLCWATHFPLEGWSVALGAACAYVLIPRWRQLRLSLLIHALSAIMCWSQFLTSLSFDSSELPETELCWVIRQLLRKWIVVSETLRLLSLLDSSQVLRYRLFWSENLIIAPRRARIVIQSTDWRIENAFLLWGSAL